MYLTEDQNEVVDRNYHQWAKTNRMDQYDLIKQYVELLQLKLIAVSTVNNNSNYRAPEGAARLRYNV